MQPSLSPLDFHERFGSEEKCLDYMVKARWPKGYNGNQSVDPVVIVKMLLLGCLYNIPSSAN